MNITKIYKLFPAESDCIAVLVPLSDATRGLFSDAAFARMKPTATLVNVARGAVLASR